MVFLSLILLDVICEVCNSWYSKWFQIAFSERVEYNIMMNACYVRVATQINTKDLRIADIASQFVTSVPWKFGLANKASILQIDCSLFLSVVNWQRVFRIARNNWIHKKKIDRKCISRGTVFIKWHVFIKYDCLHCNVSLEKKGGILEKQSV